MSNPGHSNREVVVQLPVLSERFAQRTGTSSNTENGLEVRVPSQTATQPAVQTEHKVVHFNY